MRKRETSTSGGNDYRNLGVAVERRTIELVTTARPMLLEAGFVLLRVKLVILEKFWKHFVSFLNIVELNSLVSGQSALRQIDTLEMEENQKRRFV